MSVGVGSDRCLVHIWLGTKPRQVWIAWQQNVEIRQVSFSVKQFTYGEFCCEPEYSSHSATLLSSADSCALAPSSFAFRSRSSWGVLDFNKIQKSLLCPAHTEWRSCSRELVLNFEWEFVEQKKKIVYQVFVKFLCGNAVLCAHLPACWSRLSRDFESQCLCGNSNVYLVCLCFLGPSVIGPLGTNGRASTGASREAASWFALSFVDCTSSCEVFPLKGFSSVVPSSPVAPCCEPELASPPSRRPSWQPENKNSPCLKTRSSYCQDGCIMCSFYARCWGKWAQNPRLFVLGQFFFSFLSLSLSVCLSLSLSLSFAVAGNFDPSQLTEKGFCSVC